jgi:tetratricopeptide (TPR) repeat protein
LYIKGKSCIELKKFEEAVETFKELDRLYPNEFKEDYVQAENLYNEDIKKQRNRFKKMIFSN